MIAYRRRMDMDEGKRGYSRIAYHLAKSTTCYLNAVVAVESGKGREQRLELSDNEIYAANIMLIIAVNKVSIVFQQNPSAVHYAHIVLDDRFWPNFTVCQNARQWHCCSDEL